MYSKNQCYYYKMNNYLIELQEIFKFNMEAMNLNISVLANKIINAVQKSKNVWIFGNGGSASTAEHFETDLLFIRENNLFGVQSVNINALSANSAKMSALSNDVGFENSLSLMLKRKSTKGDLLILISASGNSQNIINGFETGMKKELEIYCILGFDGGNLVKSAKDYLLVKSEIGKYGQVEDLHLAFCHAVSTQVREHFNSIGN